MTIRILLRPLVFAAALLCPVYAHAVSITFNFTGIAVPKAQNEVFGYYVVNGVPSNYVQSLTGNPVTGTVHVTGTPGNLYVDYFSDTWSNDATPGVTNGWSANAGAPDNPNNEADPNVGFVSTATLGATASSILLSANQYYQGNEDGTFDLSLNWATTAGQQFLDGQGQADADVDVLRGNMSEYFSYSDVPFTLTSLTETVGVPEPATWALMLTGFAGVGWVVRSRQRFRPA